MKTSENTPSFLLLISIYFILKILKMLEQEAFRGTEVKIIVAFSDFE